MRRSSNNYTEQRGNLYSSANRVAAPVYRLSSVLPDLVRRLEDRRTFHPLRDFRPARALSRFSAEVVLSRRADKVQRTALPTDVFRFRVPAEVALCAKRQRRKEVLFAKKLTRKGSGAKNRNRNYFTGVSCR